MTATAELRAGGPAPTSRRQCLGRRGAVASAASYGVTLFVLITLNFALPRLMPGNPIAALGDSSSPTYVSDASVRAALERYYGLDHSLLHQYGAYLWALAHGQLGESIRYGVPVSSLLAERIPWTLLLVGTALVTGTLVGLAAGVHSGWHRGRPADRGLLVLFVSLRNFPAFFLGSLALFVFSVKLRWFPVAGAYTPGARLGAPGTVLDVLRHLALPAAVLAIQFAVGTYLVMRAGMVGELGSDHLVLGRVKGLRDRRLKYRYAARNALLPVVNLTALQVGFSVTGTIFVEAVFAYPGLGRLLFDAAAYRDYPTLQGCFLVLTVSVVTANFVADRLHARLDPRTRR